MSVGRRAALAAVSLLIAPLGASATASAGTYDVRVCGGGPNLAWAPSATGADMAVYPGAPGCSEDGLVVRNVDRGPGSSVPAGAASRWRFDALTGTGVVGIYFDGSFLAADPGWQAMLSNGSQWLGGCRASSGSCGLDLPGQFFTIPRSGSVYAEAYCTSGTCPTNGIRAKVAMRNVALRIQDDTAPTLANPRGRAWTQPWIGGGEQVSFDAADESGVTAVQTELDGKVVGYQARACDAAAKRCPDWAAAAADVNTRGVADGQHTLTVKAIDRAGNVSSKDRSVGIDNTAPIAPVGLRLSSGAVWRPGAQVDLAWSAPPQEYAPISGAVYRACPAGTAANCTTGEGSDPTILQLKLPDPGLYDVTVWLKDAAGNATAQNAAPPLQVGWDADAPTDVAFAPQDPSNPAQLRVDARDATSGIAGGRVEYRRVGRKTWHAIRTSANGGGVVATMPDGRLADGRYQLRAFVRDAAGNARATGKRASGRKAFVRLPLRVKARLVVGKTRRATVRKRGRRVRRTVYATAPRVRVGRAVVLRGRLVAPGGNPLAGASIDVFARPDRPKSAFKPVGKLTTGPKGRFAYRSPGGASRVVRFVYAGAAKIRPQTKAVRVRVPAESSIRASRRSIVNGEAVDFTGRVKTGPLPATGKLIELQFFSRGRWRTFRTTHTQADGRWRANYRFTETIGRQTYRLRVHMPRESGYTYAEGSSRAVRVTVQGL